MKSLLPLREIERSEMHSRVRLKIPPFDRLRVVSEVEPPEAGVMSM
jgi:hypothetical protein